MIKIAFCCNNFRSLNGLERVWSQRMSLLAENEDFEITLITYNQYGHPFSFKLSEKIFHKDLATRYLYGCSYRGLYQYYDRFVSRRVFKKALADCLIQMNPDIVVCIDHHISDMNVILKSSIKAVKIIECHRGKSAYFSKMKTATNLKNRIFCYVQSYRLIRTILKFDKIVVMTDREAKEWNNPNKVISIHNMLPFNLEKKDSSKTYKKVISVGRLSYQKGFDLLFLAWKQVSEKYPDWVLDVYGTNDMWTKKLQDQLVSLNVHSIHILSSVDDIFSKYVESDFYVMSSRYESFGLVLIEAMSCGLPVVSFDCKYGPSEIIDDGAQGILVPSENVDKLADGICYMIEHPEERERMGSNAYTKSLLYKPENIMAQWLSFYNSLK